MGVPDCVHIRGPMPTMGNTCVFGKKKKSSSSILGRAGVVCYLGADPSPVTCTGWGPGNTWGPGFGLWSLFLPTVPASRVHGGAIPPPTGAEGNIENKEGVQKVIDTKK